MIRTKKVRVVYGDGDVVSVTLQPRTSLRTLQRLLALPQEVNFSADSLGRVLLPHEDLFEVLANEDTVRVEPAAHLGSSVEALFWLLISLLAASQTIRLLERLVQVFSASRGARERPSFSQPIAGMPPSDTSVLIKEVL